MKPTLETLILALNIDLQNESFLNELTFSEGKKTDYEEIKKQILKISKLIKPLENSREKSHLTIINAYLLTKYLNFASLSNDLSIHKSIAEFGIFPENPKWIITNRRIINQLERINRKGDLVVSYEAVYRIVDLYMYHKLFVEVISNLGIISYDSKTKITRESLSREINNAIKNINNRNKKGSALSKNGLEGFLIEAMELSKAHSDSRINIINILTSIGSKRSAEIILTEIFKSAFFIINPKLKQSELYRTLYPLFSVILYDKELPTNESEYKVYVKNYTGYNFAVFQARFMRKLEKKQ